MPETNELMTAVEHLLAEMGVTEPGAGAANHEAPAGELMDKLYDAWNGELRRRHGEPDAIFEPEGPQVKTAELTTPAMECTRREQARCAAEIARDGWNERGAVLGMGDYFAEEFLIEQAAEEKGKQCE
jgi:hypothetical protein